MKTPIFMNQSARGCACQSADPDQAPAFSQTRPQPRRAAFTLIELLTVMAVIGILAALIFPVTRGVKKKRLLAVAQSELKQVETAIEDYKARLGFYPPDNPGNPVINQLYFELLGTYLTSTNWYITLDGSAKISPAGMQRLFGSNNINAVTPGFANSSQNQRGTDEKAAAVAFLKGLRPNQIGQIVANSDYSQPLPALLVCSIGWPDPAPPPFTRLISYSTADNPHAVQPGLNPWRYVSTNPTNNPSSYDLWIDVVIGTSLYRVSNWNSQPQQIQ
jgi:prepilin-type N-terminal cleavage/methylation domain-containing protein